MKDEQEWLAAPSPSPFESKTLIIMRGAPGNGKSSIVSEIVAGLEPGTYGVCSADHHFYDRHGVYKWEERQLRKAHDFCYRTCSAYMLQEKQVIFIDNTNIKRNHYEKYIAAAKKQGYTVMQCVPHHHYENIHGVKDDKVEEMQRNFEEDVVLMTLAAPETAHREDLARIASHLAAEARKAVDSVPSAQQDAAGIHARSHRFHSARSHHGKERSASDEPIAKPPI